MKNKKDFPILSEQINGYSLCYLDNASTTQKPQQVLDELMRFYKTSNANIYRGTYSLGERATEWYERSRERVAAYLNAATPAEIIFTQGTTEGINAVATAWGLHNLKDGDEILLTELEHHSNIVPWQQVAKRTGAKLTFIPVNDQGLLIMDTIDQLITAKTKIVSVIHVSNAIGTTVDIKTIISRAKGVGAITLIDAAQSVPHQKISVTDLDCDFLVFSGHKMLAPTGIGVLYINRRMFDQMPPYQFGGGMIYEAHWHSATFLPAPQKYEAGTPPIAQAIGLAAAIEYLNNEVDLAELRKHEARLCAQLIDGLSSCEQVTMLGPVDELRQEGHLVSFVVEGIHAHDVVEFMSRRGICLRAGHHCAQTLAKKQLLDASVRASFYLYNTSEDVERLLESINVLLKQP